MNLFLKLHDDTKISQFIRFVIVGGLATAIHYVIYILLTKLGVALNIGYSIGYGLSFIFNYIASNYFTFKSKPTAKRGIRFAGAHLCNYFLQIALLNIYIYIGIPKMVAPIGVFVVAIPVNFILVRFALKH